MSAGALVADSIVFLAAGFVSAVAFCLGLARHHSLWRLAAPAVGGLLLAVGLALLLDLALLGMVAFATAVLSGLYVLVALYDFFFQHRDDYAVPLLSPEAERDEPDCLRVAVYRAISLLQGEDAGEALRILRDATWRET